VAGADGARRGAVVTRPGRRELGALLAIAAMAVVVLVVLFGGRG